MTSKQAEKVIGRLADRLDKGLNRAVTDTLSDILRTAQRWSSGPVSTTELRRLDHPYARRHGRPRRNPARINKQTGIFYSGWEEDGPHRVDGDLVGTVKNESPNAGFLAAGTNTMFARPLPEQVVKEVEPRLQRRLEREAERLIR